jgi:hypothetical protein
MSRSSIWLAGPFLVAACHSTPPGAVPIAGEAAAISRLAGTWQGSYQSPAVGRAGSILFTLTAGEDHAHGDVVMVPNGANRPLRPAPATGVSAMDSTQLAQVLTVEFVRAAGDSVMGTLAPYADPDCNCSTAAAFRGKLDGNRIRGTFVATQSVGRSMSGTWEVRRKN